MSKSITPAASICIFLLAQKNTKKGRPPIITPKYSFSIIFFSNHACRAGGGGALMKLLYYCGEEQRFPDVVPGKLTALVLVRRIMGYAKESGTCWKKKSFQIFRNPLSPVFAAGPYRFGHAEGWMSPKAQPRDKMRIQRESKYAAQRLWSEKRAVAWLV